MRQQAKDQFVEAAAKNDVAFVLEQIDGGLSPDSSYTDGYTALMAAAQWNAYDTAKVLLEKRANPNLSDRIGRTPLSYAVREGRVKLVTLLMDAGADVGAKIPADAPVFSGFGLLHFVGNQGSVEIAAKLVSAGVDVNEVDSENETPLMKAARSGHAALSEFLLRNGADPSIVNVHGENAFVSTKEKGHD